MSKPQAIQVTIKYYDQEILVVLPLDYNVFINNIMTMLQIEKNQINKFKISYTNFLDNKNYLIEDYPSYSDFLDNYSKNYAKIINIELANEENNINNNDDEDNNKNNMNNSDEIMNEIEVSSKKMNKEKYISGEININNNHINNIKNYGNINNNKNEEDNEAFEFSCLSINENNNIIEENNINNNKIKEKKKNFNNLFGENKFINEPEKNDILGNKYGIAFNINCAFCKQKKKCDIFYYCKDCDLFFCKECEKNQGMNHKHCYFKIRNKDQYSEINELHSFGDKLENINNNLNASIINNGYIVQESVKEIISEGSKFFGNIGTSIKNFFKGNENDNNQNNNNNINNQINNDINLNDLNNPYAINNNINLKNNINVQDENQLKELVKKAKMDFDLSPFSDIEIQKALIENKGNIDKAASMLITNFNI